MNDLDTCSIVLNQQIRIQTLLLTNRALRSEYRQNRVALLHRLGIDASVTVDFPVLNADDLDAQARTLIDKRWHEVQKLLALPDGIEWEGIRDLYRDYAESYWPEGHHRHELDAVAFVEYLRSKGCNTIADWRINLLRFRARQKRLALHWVRLLPVKSRCRFGIQFLYRRNSMPAQLLCYIAA